MPATQNGRVMESVERAPEVELVALPEVEGDVAVGASSEPMAVRPIRP